MSTHAHPKDIKGPEDHRDHLDWVLVPSPPPIAHHRGEDDDAASGAAGPISLSRIISEGRLRDSFELARCPRDNHHPSLQPPARRRRRSFFSSPADPPPAARAGQQQQQPLRRSSSSDDALGVCARRASSSPSHPRALRRAHTAPVDTLRDTYPRPVPGDRMADGSAIAALLLDAEEEQQQGSLTTGEGTAGSGRPARRFGLSAIKARIMGLVGRGRNKPKPKPKPKGDEKAVLEPQQQQQAGVILTTGGQEQTPAPEEKEKVVVSVEPVDPFEGGSSEDSSDEGWRGGHFLRIMDPATRFRSD